jgi:ribonuclease HI
VMAYIRTNRNDITVTLRSDVAKDLDIQVLDVQQRPHPTTMLVNIYNPPRPSSSRTRRRRGHGAIERLRQLPLPDNTPVIISGDFNLHHHRWSYGAPNPSPLAESTIEWFSDQGFTLKNQKGIATYFGHQKKGHVSVIDLTWTNAIAETLDIGRDWIVEDRPEWGCGSDHHMLRWSIDYGEMEVENLTGTRYNFNKADPEEWTDIFTEHLNRDPIRWREVRDINQRRTPEEIEEDVRLFTEAMTFATQKAIPERRPSERAKPWWTKELDTANEERERLRREQQEHVRCNRYRNGALHAKIRKQSNLFHKRYRYEKDKWLTETLQEIKPTEIFGLRKWTTGARNYPSPAIQRDGGTPAITHAEKCDALRRKLFKPPPELADNPMPDLENARPNDIQHTRVTKAEVREALYTQSPKKAPGVSQISFQALRWIWQAESDTLYAIIHHCAEAGYHPRPWRTAVAVALRKPRKGDYSAPKSYRLIQLLECLGKVLEKVQATRLSYLVETERLVPETQFGGRPGSSTVDAMMSYVEDVEAARNHKLVTSVLTFDISGFFDNVNHNRLLRVLREKRIPLPLIRWVASFLTDRQAAVCLDGKRGEMAPIETGIPQGSPVSPVLSILYTADLPQVIGDISTNNKNTDKTTPTAFKMYMDDGHITVSSKTLETNVATLSKQFRKVRDWLRRAGLTADLDKSELIHHTWRRMDSDNLPSLRLVGEDGKTTVIRAGENIRWLGVYFDRKLTFKSHIRQLADRAREAVNASRMLANTVRGLNQTHLRTLYRSCILPMISYGSEVWWNGKTTQIESLARVQNAALRHITAAFRTTPVRALELETGIPPLNISLDLNNSRYANRLHRLSPHNPVIQRLGPDWIRGEATLAPPLPSRPMTNRGGILHPTKTSSSTRLQRTAKKTYDPKEGERVRPMTLPPWRRRALDYGERLKILPKAAKDKEEAAKAHRKKAKTIAKDNASIAFYTDGSLLESEDGINRVGYGVAGYRAGKEIYTHKAGMGRCVEVWDAEIAGLAKGVMVAYQMAKADRTIKSLYFFSDNNAAVQCTFDATSRPGQQYLLRTRNLISKILELRPGTRVTIAWCPGHTNVKGNEKADELAKEGAETDLNNTIQYTSLTHAKRRAKEDALGRWRREWMQTRPSGGFTPADRIPPRWKPNGYFGADREVYGRIVQCRTGHGFTGEYYNKFVPSENISCPCDNGTYQTREHILLSCPLYRSKRQLLEDDDGRITSLHDLLGTRKGLQRLETFLTKTGAFTKTGHPRPSIRAPLLEDPEEDSDGETEGEGYGWDDPTHSNSEED